METSKVALSGQSAAGPDEPARITQAARLLGGLTLLSRIAGLLRDLVIAAWFGASAPADAFFVAFRIPNLFRRIVAEGAASTAFVPVFTSYRTREGDRSAAQAAAAVGGAAVLVLVLLVGAGVLFADPVVSLFAPGFGADPAKRALTVSLVRWTFPYLLLVGLAAWAMGTLHSFRRFLEPSLGPILLNMAIIASALTLASRLNEPVYALAIGVLIGGSLQFLVQVPALGRFGVRWAGMWRRRHAARPRVGRLLVPTLFGGAVYQIGILVSTVLASLLPERSISYLWYADRVFEFPLGIVAVAVGTAALPSLSGQASAGRYRAMASSASYAMRLVWALAVPAMVGIWLLAPAIVEVLFQRGRFSAQDTAMTAWALRAYALGMLGVASTRVLISVFYALERPRVPVFTATIALLVNAACDVALMGPPEPGPTWWGSGVVAQAGVWLRLADLDHAGLALGTAIGATVNALLLFYLARKRVGTLLGRGMLTSTVRHSGCAALMAAAVIAWQRSTPAASVWLQLAGALAIGGAVYVLAALLSGSDEMRRLIGWRAEPDAAA